jgi:hypothetical protein
VIKGRRGDVWLDRSVTFDLLHRAILDRNQVTCLYGGHAREVCPYILGHTAGKERVLVFQFGGSSRGGLPPGGNWRCFDVDGMTNVQQRDGPWHGGAEHRTRQQCVDEVFIDVNLEVPNQPGRQG